MGRPPARDRRQGHPRDRRGSPRRRAELGIRGARREYPAHVDAPPRTPIPALWALPVVVESARIRLRPIAASDADALFPFVSCFEDNHGSRRVIEKTGFRFLCRAEDDLWRDGRWISHLRYEQLASEWADSTRTLREAILNLRRDTVLTRRGRLSYAVVL